MINNSETLKRLIKASFVFICIFLGTNVLVTEATGGEVSTTSGITFIKDDDASIKKPDKSKKPEIKNKPIIDSGKKLLPKTGEIMSNLSTYGLFFILMYFLYYLFVKRRRNNEE